MKAKEFEVKPRNFVAKNAKMGGAGQHKDKKKAEKQGDAKHKKQLVPMETIEQKLTRKIQENIEQGVAEGGSNLSALMNKIKSLDKQEMGPVFFQSSEWKGVHSLIYDLTFRRMSNVEAFKHYKNVIDKANRVLQDYQQQLEALGIQTKLRVPSLQSAMDNDRTSDENDDSDDGYSEYEQSLGGELQFKLPAQGVAEVSDPEYDDEAGMSDNNLETLKRSVAGIDDLIQPGDNLPEWCQEKIAVANSMLVTVWDYMLSEKESEQGRK